MIRGLNRCSLSNRTRVLFLSWAHPLLDQGRLHLVSHGCNSTLVDETFIPLQLASTRPRPYNSTTPRWGSRNPAPTLRSPDHTASH